MKTTTKTTCMGTTAKARPPAGGKASCIAAVIKATEGAGAGIWLSVKGGGPTSVERVAMADIPVIEVAVVEIVVTEIVTVDDRSAMGDVSIVVVNRPAAVPVVSPVMPAPPKSSEKADPESDSKSNPHTAKEDSWHGIPAWVRDDWRPVYEPRIVSRHVDYIRIGRFDDNRIALSCYLLLLIAIEVAGLARLLAHRLNRGSHILRLVRIGVAQR